MSVTKGDDEWSFESKDDFYMAYDECNSASFVRFASGKSADSFLTDSELYLHFFHRTTEISVGTQKSDLDSGQRNSILEVFEVFDNAKEQCRLPDLVESDNIDAKPVIFIGHGQSQVWRDLKDHLKDKHHYNVETFESGVRAGHETRDVLESMLNRSSFALLVLTKEDETHDGKMRARQNVIHETGLFQGKLGFARAIVLLENGTEEFSNINGIQQIRFASIDQTFGDILAILKREFGDYDR